MFILIALASFLKKAALKLGTSQKVDKVINLAQTPAMQSAARDALVISKNLALAAKGSKLAVKTVVQHTGKGILTLHDYGIHPNGKWLEAAFCELPDFFKKLLEKGGR